MTRICRLGLSKADELDKVAPTAVAVGAVLFCLCASGCVPREVTEKMEAGFTLQFEQKNEEMEEALSKISAAMSKSGSRSTEKFRELHNMLVRKYQEGHKPPKLVFFAEDATAPAAAAAAEAPPGAEPAKGAPAAPQKIKSELLSQRTLQHRDLELLWNVALDGSGVRSADLSDGYLYLVTRKNKMYSIALRSGLTRWVLDLGQRPDTPPGFNDRYVVISAGDVIHVIDKRSGKDESRFETNIQPSSRPYCDYAYFVFGCWTGDVCGFEFGHRFPTWRFSAFGRVFVTPFYSEGSAYAATDNGKLASYDTTTRLTGDVTDLGSRPVGGLLATKKLMFTGTEKFEMLAFRIDDGSKAWTHCCSGRVVGGPWLSAGGDVLYYTAERDGLYAVSADSGKQRWRAPGVVKPVAISGDSIFVLTNAGSLCKLDAGTGEVIWSEPTKPFVDVVDQTQEEIICLISQRGQIFAIAPKK